MLKLHLIHLTYEHHSLDTPHTVCINYLPRDHVSIRKLHFGFAAQHEERR
jgi:hypothetical protein